MSICKPSDDVFQISSLFYTFKRTDKTAQQTLQEDLKSLRLDGRFQKRLLALPIICMGLLCRKFSEMMSDDVFQISSLFYTFKQTDKTA